MAFPSSSNSLAAVWQAVQATAGRIRVQAQTLRDEAAAADISTKKIVDFSTECADVLVVLDRAAATPGIAQYARDQIGNQLLDVVAEFTAMRAQIVTTRLWITTNFPQDVGGYLLFIRFDVDGRYTFRVLTPAQTAGLRTQLDALIATIS